MIQRSISAIASLSETFTPSGNWSTYPPHKHDTENPPVESQLEELYFYRFERPVMLLYRATH